MESGILNPAEEMTPLELAIFQQTARDLRAAYSEQREEWFLSIGRSYHANPKPGRPK